MGRLLRSAVLMLHLSRAQRDSFPEELRLLKRGKLLLNLSPQLDDTGGLSWAGGHLRRSDDVAYTTMHLVVLDPSHLL